MPLSTIPPYDEYVLHLQLVEAANDHAQMDCGCTARFALIPTTTLAPTGGGHLLQAKSEVVLVHRRTCGLHRLISALCGQRTDRPTSTEDVLHHAHAAICMRCKAFCKTGRKTDRLKRDDRADVDLHETRDEDIIHGTPMFEDPLDPFNLLSEECLLKGLQI